MAAVRQWSASLAGRDLRGSVRAVPVLNLPAFRARSPFVVPEDGKNLNRCFPGDPAGTLADRLAHATFTQLITGSDALIDAHCGDLPEALEPFALYEAGPSEDRALALAIAYGLGYVIRQEPGPAARSAERPARRRPRSAFRRSRPRPAAAAWSSRPRSTCTSRGLDRVLAALGMLEPTAPGRPTARAA